MPVDVEALHVTGDTVTDDNQILNTDAATDSTITPFFGGVGFGAAHSFYRLVPDISSQTFVGQTATIGADQRAASFSYPEGYRPLDRVNEFTSNYDKAIVSTFSRKSYGENSFVFFADKTAVSQFLRSLAINGVGVNSSYEGASFEGTPAIGQLSTSGIVLPGDSGGAAYVDLSGTSYVVGIASAGLDQPKGTLYSYLGLGDYYSAINLAGGAVDAPPVLLRGYDPNEVIRGYQGHASIITSGDHDFVLAGSGDTVNTGTSQNDIVFMPSAVGQTDGGTTVVVSPGTKTIVGGGPRDRLVVPTDRLLSSGSISDASSTIQLVGGSYSDNTDGITPGALSPWLSVDHPGHMDAGFGTDNGAIGGRGFLSSKKSVLGVKLAWLHAHVGGVLRARTVAVIATATG